MAGIYCGNQANYSGLVSGANFLGTNYQCMRRGIGIGRNLPYDPEYNKPYVPIDTRKFYCGKAPVPPPGGGYFAVGSPSKCQQIGVGVGKAQRAAIGPSVSMSFGKSQREPIGQSVSIPLTMHILFYLILFLLIIGGTFVIFYFTKPKFLTKKDLKTNKDIIDWSKFLPYYAVICLVVAIIIWCFCNS